MEKLIDFSLEAFCDLLRLAQKNRGKDFAQNLLAETFHNNPVAFLEFFLEYKQNPAQTQQT